MQQPPEGNYQNPPSQPYSQQPTQQSYNQPQAPVPPPPYNYNAYPPQQPLAMPRKPKRWPWIVAIIVAFVFGDMAGRGHTTTADTTAAAPVSQNTSISQVQPTQAPTKPQKPLTWTTVQTFQGNGSKKTGTFTASDDWKITWSCNPASSYGGSYNMIVSVYNSDATPADIGAINSTCQAGSIQGETEEHQAGTVYLDITSEGTWNITVQELK